jgi:hypothetical protein
VLEGRDISIRVNSIGPGLTDIDLVGKRAKGINVSDVKANSFSSSAIGFDLTHGFIQVFWDRRDCVGCGGYEARDIDRHDIRTICSKLNRNHSADPAAAPVTTAILSFTVEPRPGTRPITCFS